MRCIFVSLKAILIIFIICVIMEIPSNLKNYTVLTQNGKSVATELRKLYNADLDKVRTFKQLIK